MYVGVYEYVRVDVQAMIKTYRSSTGTYLFADVINSPVPRKDPQHAEKE
jgi:hypothetical protein